MTLASYKSVKKECSAEFAEKKSVFVGTARPAQNEAAALDFIGQMRKKHVGASHNAYAYIAREQNITRFSDDGEPSSTAGLPILSVLQKSGLTDLAVVVTRYFGGILLGAGGLVRAYSRAARLAIDAAGIALYENFTEFEVVCAYQDYDRLLKFSQSEEIAADGAVFEENIVLSYAAECGRFEKICADITNLTDGRAKITKKRGDVYRTH